MSYATDDAHRHTPVFWKKWAVAMLAVYPPLVVLVYLSRSVMSELPTPVTLFLIALCLTGLSTGLILPYLNARLAGWLHR
ncbi:hypothetical protein LVO79_19245 (plasmid) [Roseivivax marinus]|uniref:hypothetical protein n=1 Tax=Roseivivax marinus TaxID=1379903 RepID=UPI001F03A3E4|nr:hypothetical protein [Roseivivax marinus]UMA67141.1 hypothetical protein LVO79_19245 [Roseivivax marinus]